MSITMTHVTAHYHQISEEDARKLCPKLPQYGQARLVLHEGKYYWVGLKRFTWIGIIWTMEEAPDYVLVDGKAVMVK